MIRIRNLFKSPTARALLTGALIAAMTLVPGAMANHTDAHNSSVEVGSTVYSFVPLIVLLFMLGIALAALGGFAVARRGRNG